ncbi:helix-turn-helix domain-containing protein [Actinomycetes bacterium M1A6_2h]
MDSRDVVEIGRRIRNARKAAWLTQADLGDLIGVSERTVRDMEGGTGNPSMASVIAAANALGMTIGIVQ